MFMDQLQIISQILKTEKNLIGIFQKTIHNGGLLWGAWQDANNSWWNKYLGGLFDRSKEFNRRRCEVSTGPGNFDDDRKLNRHKKLFLFDSFQRFKFLRPQLIFMSLTFQLQSHTSYPFSSPSSSSLEASGTCSWFWSSTSTRPWGTTPTSSSSILRWELKMGEIQLKVFSSFLWTLTLLRS